MFFRMFGMVVEKLFVADLQKVSGTSEKKICAAGVTRILTESPVMIGQYEHLWAKLLQALIGLFELPEDDSVPADEHFIEIEDTPGLYCKIGNFREGFIFAKLRSFVKKKTREMTKSFCRY